MAVLFATGFEAQQKDTDGIPTFAGPTNPVYDTGTVRTGAASLKFAPGSATGCYITGFPPASYMHVALYVQTLPATERGVMGSVVNGQINVRLTPAGALAIYLNTTLIGTSSAKFASPGWHWVGIRQLSGTSVAFLQIDGVDEVTGTATVTVVGTAFGTGDAVAATPVYYVDDIVLDDANFLAPSKVDIALPISDNARTGTTAGAGGTTDLWDAVNNTPPAGVASASETDTTNIEFPASLTEDYVANLETYTTLGVESGDTVLAVRAIVRHGEDIATGTKTMQNVGDLTNPVWSGTTSVTFGSDGGAHGAEVGLWVTNFSVIKTSAFTITLGTSPTISVARASQSRVGCIDFMGMLVAWTPAAADSIPHYRQPKVVNQAVHRAASW